MKELIANFPPKQVWIDGGRYRARMRWRVMERKQKEKVRRNNWLHIILCMCI